MALLEKRRTNLRRSLVGRCDADNGCAV